MRTHATSPRIIFEPHALRRLSAPGDCACADSWSAPDDCACADSWSAPHMTVSRRAFDAAANYFRAANLYRAPLDDDHTLIFARSSDATPAVLNRPALAVLDAFEHPGRQIGSFTSGEARAAARTLFELGFLTTDSHTPPAPAPPTTLVAWLHVTDRCNLACDYCYLPKSGESMSADVGDAAIDAVFRAARLHGFRAVKLKFAGGEATLNFPRLLAMHDRAAAQAGDLALESVVLTNGVGLSVRRIEDLKRRRIGVMISLDGIGPAHDAQRAFADGRGSFAFVVHTIDRLIDVGHPPQISITVTERTIDRLAETVEWVLARDLSFSINFYRETDCSSSFHDLRLSEQRLIDGMRRAYGVMERRLPRFNLLGSLIDRAHLAGLHAHACGAGHSYLAINQHGGVAQCQMHLDQGVADVHAPDPLSHVRENILWLRNVPVDEKAGCRDCDWRYECAGGCPLETYRATGRWDVKSPYCRVYQSLFPEVLRLEGLRLLKHYGPAEAVA